MHMPRPTRHLYALLGFFGIHRLIILSQNFFHSPNPTQPARSLVFRKFLYTFGRTKSRSFLLSSLSTSDNFCIAMIFVPQKFLFNVKIFEDFFLNIIAEHWISILEPRVNHCSELLPIELILAIFHKCRINGFDFSSPFTKSRVSSWNFCWKWRHCLRIFSHQGFCQESQPAFERCRWPKFGIAVASPTGRIKKHLLVLHRYFWRTFLIDHIVV